jgi:hypothetical protein
MIRGLSWIKLFLYLGAKVRGTVESTKSMDKRVAHFINDAARYLETLSATLKLSGVGRVLQWMF